MIFVDTNIIVDIFERDPDWFDWSADRLSRAAMQDGVAISAVAVAELCWTFDVFDVLAEKLRQLSLDIAPTAARVAFVAGKRFQAFRNTRRPADHPRVLPDFLIGAQALIDEAPLLTRDPRLYRRYFPDLTLITPETHP